nr:restriction endonuclease subunit S [uncultured Flavobacterium sp.]
MREGWKEVELGTYCKILSSKRIFASDYTDSGIPFYRSKEIIHKALKQFNGDEIFISEKKFNEIKIKFGAPKKGDILISSVGNRSGIPYLVREEYDFYFKDGNLIWLKDFSKDLDSNFLEYFLNSNIGQKLIDSMMIGAAQKALTIDGMNRIKIPLPSRKAQSKIASILSAYDNLIDNNLKRIKLLEEKAQLTYEEWFVKMRFPGFETAKFDEVTGLREGWEKKTIGEVCKVSGGGTPSRASDEYWIDGDITWYSPTDLSKANSLCVLDSSQKITDLGLKKSSAKLLDTNSFMMTSRATIGLFALVNKPFTTNQGFINVTPHEEFEKEYLLYNFKYRVEEFKGHATGATFPELSKSKFNALDIIWPCELSLKQFNKISSVLHTQLFNLTQQNRLLREARDILLPRLMSGMIDVEQLQMETLNL